MRVRYELTPEQLAEFKQAVTEVAREGEVTISEDCIVIFNTKPIRAIELMTNLAYKGFKTDLTRNLLDID